LILQNPLENKAILHPWFSDIGIYSMNQSEKEPNKDKIQDDIVDIPPIAPLCKFFSDEEYKNCEADFILPIPTLESIARQYQNRYKKECEYCQNALKRKIDSPPIAPLRKFFSDEEYKNCEVDSILPIPTLESIARRYKNRYKKCEYCRNQFRRKRWK
jgi:hypothetical protein